MKLKLISNFIDYYDHWFDIDNEQRFYRITTDGMNRGQMFGFMRQHKLTPPLYGIVSHLKNACYLELEDKVVVYTNENVHCGEGKLLMTLEEAYQQYPNCLCTQYLNTEKVFGYAVSYRHLQIGYKAFWLRYTSFTDWRSNCGDGDIDLIEERDIISINKPLFAIDFVKYNNNYYAIDFNIAPGIKGTGVEKIIPAKQVVELIKEQFEINNLEVNNNEEHSVK